MPLSTLDAASADTATRESYVKLAKVGEGTFASVFLARHVPTGQAVAIKKIKMIGTSDGLDPTALREIKFLRDLLHPNIVRLRDVFSSSSSSSSSSASASTSSATPAAAPAVNMVLDYLGSSLEDVIRDTHTTITPPDTKAWMGMCLRGIAYLHSRDVLHRDLKPNNLLFSSDGQLKIADFGLARDMPAPSPPSAASASRSGGAAGAGTGAGTPAGMSQHPWEMSTQVVTLWYRPPELLLGATWYGDRVDVWSAGCIFAELLLRKPYLPGQSDLHQFELICRARGFPRETSWPGVKSLRLYKTCIQAAVQALGGEQAVATTFANPPPLGGTFLAAREEDLSLLSGLLAINPAERISASGALAHPYFTAWPRPTHPTLLPGRPEAPPDQPPAGSGPVSGDAKDPKDALDSGEKDKTKNSAKDKTATARIVAQLREQQRQRQKSRAPASPRVARRKGGLSPAGNRDIGPKWNDPAWAERRRIARKLAFGH